MLIDRANYHAKKSCTRWNKGTPAVLHRLSRKFHRWKYRKMAEWCWTMNPKHRKLMQRYKEGKKDIDTYPWPYFDPMFVNWDESDEPDDYSLISDQSGCVVKYATSYVAWKIFEETGKWPQKKSRIRMDAKNWETFLAEAGYTTMAIGGPFNGHHYVGIKANEGEYGIVVWFESKLFQTNLAFVSTYRNKKYCFEQVRIFDYKWVQID